MIFRDWSLQDLARSNLVNCQPSGILINTSSCQTSCIPKDIFLYFYSLGEVIATLCLFSSSIPVLMLLRQGCPSCFLSQAYCFLFRSLYNMLSSLVSKKVLDIKNLGNFKKLSKLLMEDHQLYTRFSLYFGCRYVMNIA